MGDYIVTSKGLVSTDELMHYAKGTERKNHKYYKREWKNGKWQYYYSKEHYHMAKAGEAIDNEGLERNLQNASEDARYYADQMGKVAKSKRSDQVYALSKDGRQWQKGSRNSAERAIATSEAIKARHYADEYARSAENIGKAREHAARDAARDYTSTKSYKAGVKYRALKAKATYYKNKATAWLKKTGKAASKKASTYVNKGKSVVSKYINDNGKTKVTYSDVELSNQSRSMADTLTRKRVVKRTRSVTISPKRKNSKS